MPLRQVRYVQLRCRWVSHPHRGSDRRERSNHRTVVKWSGRPFTVQYCVADIVRFPEVRGDDAKLRELIEKEIWYERTDVADEIVAVARGEIRVRTTFLGHQRVSAFLEAVRNLLDDNRVDLPAWRLEPRR